MITYNVAILGATGAVGREVIKILEERNFPVKEIRLLATEKSAGMEINFRGMNRVVEVAQPGSFKGIDLAIFSAGSSASLKFAPSAVKSGAIVIDNTNAFRMDDSVPLVVPEVNPKEIFKNKGIIANPNCSTIQMVTALKPIYDEVGIKRIVVSTYQAVSGTGKDAIEELKRQIIQYTKGDKLTSKVYPYQIAFNVLPHIDTFHENGYTEEELKMTRETRKILDDPELSITATTVRVPVLYGHCESVNIETEKKISISHLRKLLDSAEGIKVVDDPEKLLYPTPLMSENDDNVMVGRLREDYSIENGINMWIVANNLRKGAALNAIQIAERLILNE